MTSDVLIHFFHASRLTQLVGYRDVDTADGCWEWFEAHAGDQCLNSGWPIYTDDDKPPSVAETVAHLDRILRRGHAASTEG